MRPNVLLVVLDSARRDALEPYGATPGSTPTIAQLANRGTSLPEVYATACWTVPSHASMFTGLLPRAAGLCRVPSAPAAKPVLEAHRERLLPEVMRRAGYATAAASANPWLSKISGFDTGFEDFASIETDRHAQIHLDAARERVRWMVEAARGRVDDGAAAVESTLTSWIEDPARRPFFWFVNLLECHSPYMPPRPYGGSLVERLRGARDLRRYYKRDSMWRVLGGAMEVPDTVVDRMRRLYRGAIRYMDDWLGRVFERLDRAGVLDDTLVIVTADHGENLGEGGLLSHGLSLDNRLIHVPLVLSGPGAEGRSITSLAELPRLLAEATGVEDHPWQEGPPRGFGVAQVDAPVQTVDAEVIETARRMGLEDSLELFATPLTCAVADGLKLLRRGDREELYDLTSDPLEQEPRNPDGADRGKEVAALRAALDHPAVSSEREEDQSAAAAPAPSADELQEIEERMKLLGYM